MLNAGCRGLVRDTPSIEEARGPRNDPMLVVGGEGNLVTQRDEQAERSPRGSRRSARLAEAAGVLWGAQIDR